MYAQLIDIIASIYITILPMVIAATISTVVVRKRIADKFKCPIDGGLVLRDGRRLFGANKTWAGAILVVLLGMVAYVGWGVLNSSMPYFADHNWLYRTHDNIVYFNLLAGFLLGVAYITLELPNSFIKRRQNITEGMTVSGIRGLPNIILDHTDSIIGCTIVLLLICPLTIAEGIAVLLIGSITHILVNVVLVAVKVKKNI